MKSCEMLKQQTQVIFDTVSAHQRPIGFLPTFKEPIQSTIVVDPSESTFHFPALPTIALMLSVFGRSALGDTDMVFAIGNDRNDPPLAQGAPQRFTVVTLVQSQPFRAPPSLTDANSIDGFQNIDLVIPIGPTQGEVQRMTVGVDDDMPFEA
jgi:hypothetical protein